MLNLQDVATRLGQGATKSDDESISACGLNTSSLHFDRLAGYFGGSLSHTILEEDLEEEGIAEDSNGEV